jgi:hypothetical protein
MSLVTQDMCDPENPEEHVLWALFYLPQIFGAVQMTHPSIYRAWSKHLHELGFRHHPELQQKKLQLPPRGPHHAYNGAGMWVDLDAPEPELPVLPDISQLTDQEKYVIIRQFHDAGYDFSSAAPDRDMASVQNGKAQR